MTKRGEFILGVVLLVVFVVFFIEAQRIPAGFMVESVQREVGADFWPKLLLCLLIILTAALNVQLLVTRKRSDKTATQDSDGEKEHWRSWLFLVLAIVIYVSIQYLVGFLIASLFLVIVSTYILGYRRKWPSAIMGLSVTLLFVLVFGRFLFVPLPKGVGIFRTISQVL